MQKVTVNLDKCMVDQIDRLARQKAVSEDRTITRTDIVAEAIGEYLKRVGKGKDNAE